MSAHRSHTTSRPHRSASTGTSEVDHDSAAHPSEPTGDSAHGTSRGGSGAADGASGGTADGGGAGTGADTGAGAGAGTGAGAEEEPGGIKGLLRQAGQSVVDSAIEKGQEKAGEWFSENVLGKSGKDDKTGAAGAAPGAGTGRYPAAGPYPGPMPPSSGSAAYAWAAAPPKEPIARLPEATHPSRNGLGGMLDEAVEYALEKSGLMDLLEKVTGDLDQLNAAAEEWQAQARGVQRLTDELRRNAGPLSEQWEGQASDSFGRHMGGVVEALDATAEDMLQTAKIINSAAQECATAEGMIVEIISEAIEALIASLAAEAVIAVLTAGIGLIADALITEAEIAVFVARVSKVSTELATTLEKLLTGLKDLGSAVKAVKSVQTAKTALAEFKNVKTAIEGVRTFEEGGEGLGKMGKDILQNKSFEGVGAGLKDYALRQGVKKADDFVTGKVEEGAKAVVGIDSDDSVETGDTTAKGLGGAAGKSAWGAAKEGLTSDVNVGAVKDEVLHDVGRADQPAPYRVDKSALESPFG